MLAPKEGSSQVLPQGLGALPVSYALGSIRQRLGGTPDHDKGFSETQGPAPLSPVLYSSSWCRA